MLIVPMHDHSVSFLGFTVLWAVPSLGRRDQNGCKQSRTCPGVHAYPEMGLLSHRCEQTLLKHVRKACTHLLPFTKRSKKMRDAADTGHRPSSCLKARTESRVGEDRGQETRGLRGYLSKWGFCRLQSSENYVQSWAKAVQIVGIGEFRSA